MKRIIILALIVATLTPYVSRADDEGKYVACEGNVISYKYRGRHIRFEDFKFQWFDLVEINLTHPEEWKGRRLKVWCNPSLPEEHILRQEGTAIKFKAERRHVEVGSLKKGAIFKDGKIVEESEREGSKLLVTGLGSLKFDKEYIKTPKIPKDHLVFAGTVSQIVLSQSEAPYAFDPWVITFSVDELISGDFSEEEFSIRVHSPSRFELKKGKRYKVKTGKLGKGLEIEKIPTYQPSAPVRSE